MGTDEEAVTVVLNRLRRARGQLTGLMSMLEAGRTCGDMVVQLAAITRALDRAGFTFLAARMRQFAADADGEGTPMTEAELERLFLMLA
jgi:DNA-binding FrmR family transcriptional regulator